MHYWNEDNFKGLLDLAGELEGIPELVGLAKYCILREKGLRRQAYQCLDQFLDEASSWELEAARRCVLTILTLDVRTPEVHQFMTYPLKKRLLFPVLEQWLVDEPTAYDPLRWLGLLRSDGDTLRAALSLQPSDIPVRSRLISIALNSAEYATHHLSESVLLLTVDETRASIGAARELIASTPDPSAFDCYSAEVDEYQQLVNDWINFSKTPDGTFPEWCEKHGRTYAWSSIIYYDADSG